MKLIHTAYEPAGPGPYPAVIALHGWGASALDLLGMAPYLQGGTLAMLCPQGPVSVAHVPGGHGWYQRIEGSSPAPDALNRAVDTASGFVDEAMARYPIDPERIVVLGFSQGGVIAYGLALRNPERFAALVAISTWLPDTFLPPTGSALLTRLPALILHGRSDDLIEIGHARAATERLRALGLEPAYREYECGHQITGDGLRDISEFIGKCVTSSSTSS